MSISAFHRPISRLIGEMAWLEDEFLDAAKTRNHREKELVCEMTVIRLYDAWARFCRELIILSAFGRTLSLAGVVLTPCNPAIASYGNVIPALFATYKKPRLFEPRWADAKECIEAARRLGVVNLNTISPALSAANSPANDIRVVRNFYAHRKKDTADKALATSIFRTVRPWVFDLAEFTSGGDRVIESWTKGLTAVAVAASQ